MKINNKSDLKGMRYPALNDLIAKANNKYELVLATAKRAREIVDGSSPLIPIKIDNAISIATEEIDKDLVKLENPYFKDGSPVKPLIDSDAIPTSTGFSALQFDASDLDDSDLSVSESELEDAEEDDEEGDESEHARAVDNDEEAPFDLAGSREDVDADVDILMQDIYGDSADATGYDDDLGN